MRTKTVSVGAVSYEVKIWAEDALTSCQDHAHGAPVIAFLTAHPCNDTRRQLMTLQFKGKEVGVSLIQTSFTGSSPQAPYDNAQQFAALVRRDGTGNINDLMRDGHYLPHGPTRIPDPDAFTALGEDQGVAIFDFWYTKGPTKRNDPELVALADVLFLNTFN